MRLYRLCNGSKDPDTIRRRLQELYDEHGDYQAVADACFVTKRTAYNWCKEYGVKVKTYHNGPVTREDYTDWNAVMERVGYTRFHPMIKMLSKLPREEAVTLSGVSRTTLYKQYKYRGLV